MNIITINNYHKQNIGSKAYTLFKMQEKGITIPSFICLSNQLLESYMPKQYHILKEQLSLNTITSTSIELQQIIDKTLKIPIISREIITKVRQTITFNNFSVRSSANLEDGSSFSFAGQFNTILNVTIDSLIASISSCMQSLFSENVLRYCLEQKIPFTSLSMNIIIQEMITSESSGIIFTSNPKGILNETVIVIGKGSGNLIVEDKIPTTTYYYHIDDNIYYYERQNGAITISDLVVKELIAISKKIKAIFNTPMDIEFSIKDSTIYILQARPITTLETNTLTILDNSNIVESYPGITKPLTISFIKEAYYGVFKGLFYRCLKDQSVLLKHENLLRNMLADVNGRVYYKISNWYTLLLYLPFSHKILPIWQDMMGVENKKVEDIQNPLSKFQQLKVYYRVLKEMFLIPKQMHKLHNTFTTTKKLYDTSFHDNISKQEVIALYSTLETKVLYDWDITLLNDLYAFIFTGLLKNKLKKLKIKDYESLTNQYISGISNMESMKPILRLLDLCIMVVKDNKVTILEQLVTNEDVAQFLKQKGSLEQEIQDYIERYGDRSLEELKLESKTFRTDPILLIQKIASYTKDKDKLEKLYASMQQEVNPVLSINASWLQRRIISFLSKKAIIGINNREISRLNRSRLYGMVRSLFLVLGKQLYTKGLINQLEDVFYLTKEELFSEPIKYQDIIKKRKQEYQIYQQLPAYSRLLFTNQEFNKLHRSINQQNVYTETQILLGTPCSNGIIEGEVIVIEDPTIVMDSTNKILVTKMTDPGWVFLLTMAKGVIAEKGSLLSHTAIISRELKIPSIVGVENVTSLLKTGDYIRMDGNSGYIEKLGEKNV